MKAVNRAAVLQVGGVAAIVLAATFVAIPLALLLLGIALIVFGTLEEIR